MTAESLQNLPKNGATVSLSKILNIVDEHLGLCSSARVCSSL